MRFKLIVLLCAFVAIFSSCDLKIENKSVDNVVVSYDFDSTKAAEIAKSYPSDISKEDCIKLHTMFRGIAMYLENVVNPPMMTADVFTIFSNVRNSYGWKTEKYKGITDAVETYLTQKGYKDPARKFEDYKLDMISCFNTLAESAKIAYLNKDAK